MDMNIFIAEKWFYLAGPTNIKEFVTIKAMSTGLTRVGRCF